MTNDPMGRSKHLGEPPLPAPNLVPVVESVSTSCGHPTLRAAKRQRAAGATCAAEATYVAGEQPVSATQAATCCCRWLSETPESTARSFEVWLSTEQLIDHQPATASSSGAADSELMFSWRIRCEKHIPFCVKELSGQGRLCSSSNWRCAVNVDLSRSGYGLVTLTVSVGGAEGGAAHATTVREVCTDLPQGRSMTRAAPASSTGPAGARQTETWAGEHRWHDAARRRRQRVAVADGWATSTDPLKPISHIELAKHREVGDGWVAVGGLVFDVSEFLSHHPGGVRTLLGALGADATEQFNAVHPHVDAEAVMNIGCCVKGRLVPEQLESTAQCSAEKSDD